MPAGRKKYPRPNPIGGGLVPTLLSTEVGNQLRTEQMIRGAQREQGRLRGLPAGHPGKPVSDEDKTYRDWEGEFFGPSQLMGGPADTYSSQGDWEDSPRKALMHHETPWPSGGSRAESEDFELRNDLAERARRRAQRESQGKWDYYWMLHHRLRDAQLKDRTPEGWTPDEDRDRLWHPEPGMWGT
jgi:hypothetical protein|tara:strand:- start:1591 stop:2145 length:555 start_codon:yes stop_codon:yes gene_type:complete